MSSMVPDGNEEQVFIKTVDYALKNIQYVQGKQKIQKITSKNPNFYFVMIGNQSIQVRRIGKVNITHLISQQELNIDEILKYSHVEDTIEFEHINKFQKKDYSSGSATHYIVGIYDNRSADRDKITIVFRLHTQQEMDMFYDEANKKWKQQKDYLKKSTTNFLGIEENIRKIVDKILVSSYPKREVYNKICDKLSQKNIKLGGRDNKMMLFALIGNHPQMQSFLRKQKIQAYEIEKKRYEQFLRQQSLTNMAEVLQPGKQHIIQRYSEKRKLDGLIIKKQKQPKEVDNAKIQQQLFLGKIPIRTEYQIDELIGLQRQATDMQIEDKPSKGLPMNFQSCRAQKIKIPDKDYGIMNKQVDRIHKQPIAQGQIFDRNTQVPIQAVKFMYQLMKANAKYRVQHSTIQGPMDQVLQCLRDVLTQYQRKPDIKDIKGDRKVQNKAVNQLLQKARINYLSYRRNPIKFY